MEAESAPAPACTPADNASTHAVYQQGLDLARNALDEVRRMLKEYDIQYVGVSEKASAYLGIAVDRAHNALAELGQITESLKTGPTEVPVRKLTNALAQVSSAFTQLVDLAHKYDETYKLSTHVSSLVAHPREQANAALATIAAYAAHAADNANAQLQGVSDGLRAKLAQTASVGLDRALPQAVRADEMFHVSEKAASTKALVLQTMRDLDEKFGISGYLQLAADRAQSLDQKITGGRLTPAISSAYNMGWQMVGAVQGKYEEKKRELAA